MTGKTKLKKDTKRTTKKIKGSNTVIQRNELVEANNIQSNDKTKGKTIKTTPLTAQEHRVLNTIISLIDAKAETFDTVKFDMKEFCEFLGMKYENHYTYLRNILRSLRQTEVTIESNDTITEIGWIRKPVLHKGTGIMEIFFEDELKPFLVNIDKNFTNFKLEEFLKLKTKHGQSLYQLTAKAKGKRNHKFGYELIKLRKIFGIKEGAYEMYADFKRKVILPAIKDLHESTGYKLGYKEIKVGRSVESIEFMIEERPNAEEKAKQKKTKKVTDVELPRVNKKGTLEEFEEFVTKLKEEA